MTHPLDTLPTIFPGTVTTWLRRLHLVARRALEGGAGGRFASLFRGAGITFEELREYQPGDDIRAIEWKATARFGVPFVKRFIEERELSVIIALDKSGSMAFGSDVRSKWHTAVETAALLAWIAAYNRERVGLALFDQNVRHFLPPRRGTRQAMREAALMFLQRPEHEPTSLAQLCRFLARVLRRRSLIVIVSDYLDCDYVADFRQLAQRHDVIAVRIYDAAEGRLAQRGWFLLQDAESPQRIWLDASSVPIRQHWQQIAEQFTQRLQLAALAADIWNIGTSDDLLASLQHWLTQRERRFRYHAEQRSASANL